MWSTIYNYSRINNVDKTNYISDESSYFLKNVERIDSISPLKLVFLDFVLIFADMAWCLLKFQTFKTPLFTNVTFGA